MKQPRRRPKTCTAQFARKIAAKLQRGIPLVKICRDREFPSVTAVNGARNRDKKIDVLLARARENGHDMLSADCLEIADRSPVEKSAIAKARLRIETRLKLLAVWDPKRYGQMIKLGDPSGQALVPPALKIGLVGGPVKIAPKAKPKTRK